ncbi:MAG TPA: hypothetical protein P5218_03655, partial [Planctomycetota bacterium]|nr:hypothetical protein [Planctomycetota bacterium]
YQVQVLLMGPAFEEATKSHAQAVKDLAKAKQEFDQKTAEIQGKRLERDVELYQRMVTLGRWHEVQALFQTFGPDMERPLYENMMRRLAQSPPQPNGNLQQFWEKNTFGFDDILDLIEIAPKEFKKSDYDLVNPLLRLCLDQGNGLEEWLERLRQEVGRSEDERRLTRRQAALLLTGQGLNEEMGEFLPSLGEAITEDDREGLNLLARHLEMVSDRQKQPKLLEEAWEATMAALAPGKIEDDQKTEALKRAVNLAPRLQDGNGDEWLMETFTSRPERGMEVLATIGRDVSTGMVEASYDPDRRLAAMKLMRTAVDALLEKAPERAGEWTETLGLLADCWLREAQHSYEFSESDESGPTVRRDSYGNVYWTSYSRGYRSNPVQPLAPGELLDIRPDGRWRELLSDSVRPVYDTTIAELFLKVNEEKKAFPYIEQLVGPNPRKANELAAEFLNVWIRNNDPNADRNRMDYYSYSFGYNNRASGIPLTRSKQERNLRDLAEWVGKLKSVPGIKLDSDLLMRAFTASHSYAEVYRIETMEEVFGSLEELDPKTLASMAQTMRANLAGLWRRADVQANAKTNRKKKDIEAEVQKGYAMAQEMLGRALEAHPDDWRLQVARAAMMHDLNNYKNEIQKASDFSGNRQQALALFQQAAANYAAGIEDLRQDEYSNDAFTAWFYAALGATDIDAIDQNTILASGEIPKIRDVLESIPGEAAEVQMGMFANSLFKQLGEVNPSVKTRYLEAGFDIVGEHPQASAARKVYDYYADLVTEIELAATVDGDGDVGTEPFGVKVELRYTKEIERESGGFQKYLQNQANQVNAYYNYGRPQENYRDKFEEAARTVLSEQFDVLSVTFNKEEATSKATNEYGWRRTPYAYILLKAKGPEVDRIPPLKIDLDFNDISGYVILPIASPVVTIDASRGDAVRPYANLQLTQVLDERRAAEGVLGLEIKAQAEGLVPALDQIADLVPGDFEVVSTDDPGASVARFSDDEESVVTERLWNVQMRAKEGVAKPTQCRFAVPKDDATQVVYQRYDDADLVTAGVDVNLLAKYASQQASRWYWLPIGALLAAFLWVLMRSISRAPEPTQSETLMLPTDLTPFNVISLLRRVQSAPHLAEPQRRELEATVQRIERYYFGQTPAGDQPDLTSIAQQWLRRA